MSAASPKSPQPSAPPTTTVPASTDPNSTQLYINNLSFNTTPEGLTAFFASSLSQPPQDVNIILHKHSGRSKGFGFVRVSNADAAAALALNGRELDGRELGIAEAVEKTEEERTAQRARRDARRAAVQAKRRAESGGAAAGSGSGAAIDEAGGAQLTSSDKSLPRPRPVREPRVVPDNHTQLYVSNLSYAVTTEQLKKEVEDTIGGVAAEVDIIKRKGGASDGRSRGYGFVTVPNDKLDKALTLNGRSIEDRPITVVVAKERPVREPAAAGTAAATGGDEAAGGAAPAGGARRKRPNRRRGPRANGDGTPETLEAAPAGSGSIYADGSSAPSPSGPDATGQQRRRQHRNRKPRGGGQANAGNQNEVAATQQ